jgi:methionine aminotransferase
VNLGQGFPDYPVDPRLAPRSPRRWQGLQPVRADGWAAGAARGDRDQAAREPRDFEFDPGSEVTMTCGATEAMFSAIQSVVGPGDEVIVFDPAYDSYDPACAWPAGAASVPLQPPVFRFDWDRVRAALTPRTRLMILNTPQNPACTVTSAQRSAGTGPLLRGRTGSHVLRRGLRARDLRRSPSHASAARAPGPARAERWRCSRSARPCTPRGWRVGYCVAPPRSLHELRKVHQFNTFTIATALQHAVAAYLGEKPGVFAELAPFFTAKRRLLTEGLAGSVLRVLPSQGTYFTLVDYSASQMLGALDDMEAARVLLENVGVAAIPLTPFYREPVPHRLLRLCFAKQDATLARAGERLRALR